MNENLNRNQFVEDLASLPKPGEHMMRLYRGDLQNRSSMSELSTRAPSSTAGRWFTSDPAEARMYAAARIDNTPGEVSYVDVKKRAAKHWTVNETGAPTKAPHRKKYGAEYLVSPKKAVAAQRVPDPITRPITRNWSS